MTLHASLLLHYYRFLSVPYHSQKEENKEAEYLVCSVCVCVCVSVCVWDALWGDSYIHL